MTYNEALNFISSAKKFGVKLGLQNIRELLCRLGNPDKALKFVHVAGTNGKGTVTSTIASILSAQGYRVGIYTSPFVYVFNERISIGGELISDEDLALCTNEVKKACEQMDGHPTEFEIVTAIGLYYFYIKKCDYVVLEVGMGGRLDATNVIDSPLVSVITSISFDHTEYLGETIKEICAEKCGIIKKGTSVAIYSEQNKDALDVIMDTCNKLNVKSVVSSMPIIKKQDITGTIFDFEEFTDLKLHLLGKHMANNVSTAITACKLLREKGVTISDDSIRQGIYNVRWPGRFEKIYDNPLVIIDGAHNMSGIRALKHTINNLFPDTKKIFVIGMLRDKEYEQALKELGGMAELIVTVDVPSPRTLLSSELAEIAKKYNKNVYDAKKLSDAAEKIASYSDDTAIFVFGSLYMIGDMKREIYKKLHI